MIDPDDIRSEDDRPEGHQPDGYEPGPEHSTEDDSFVSAAEEEDRFEFAEDDNDRLPWLESDEDEDDEEGDGGRILGFVLAGLLALVVLVGGIWWASHRSGEEPQVADGSVIAAPSTPYKEAPKDPGGKTFDGTGDSAFAVSEGQTRPASLATASPAAPVASPAPKPSIAITKPAPQASAKPAPAATPSAAPASGPVVQVGAYMSRASAEAAWQRLSASGPLAGQRHQVVEGKADIGTVYRLQAIPGDAAAARALCAKVKAAGMACQVK